MEAPDFSGWATKAGMKCSDGLTIMPGAFQHMDKAQVPLVWQHTHSKLENVLGHAVLENKDEGVYAHAYFNDTAEGQRAKALVEHGDIKSLSIYANQVAKKGQNVVHGMIREVSLVLAGANPGALIDRVNIRHSDGEIEELDDEFVIHTGIDFVIHAGKVVATPADGSAKQSSMPPTPPVKTAPTDNKPADNNADPAKKDVSAQDVYDTFNPEQRDLVNWMIGTALDNAAKDTSSSGSGDAGNNGDAKKVAVKQSEESGETDSISHTQKEGADSMSRNVFDQTGAQSDAEQKHIVSHDDMKAIFKDALRVGSIKDAVEGYAIKHGINNIDLMFPDAKALSNRPEFIKRRTEWVDDVLKNTRHSPFARVKTLLVDLTPEEARAKGYVKGAYKLEEWIGVTKRTTTPTTIYKKQKLDRDDILDITDLDVVAFLKEEMRLMLDEEAARAILIGDGRSITAEDKVKDPAGASEGSGIRSIVNDHELFVTTLYVNVSDANSNYEEVVDAVMDGMEFYKGSGVPTLYTTTKQLNMFKKSKDLEGRRYYKNNDEVAEALGVDRIVIVEPMNEVSDLVGIIVNLSDYNIGTDKGGEVNYFDDFDINYNQQLYLMETRFSGALVKPKAALVIRKTAAANVLVVPTAPTFDKVTGVVTIPTVTGVVYKNADTSATLTAGAQTALTSGQTLRVQAYPATNYYFADNASDQWTFKKA